MFGNSNAQNEGAALSGVKKKRVNLTLQFIVPWASNGERQAAFLYVHE